MKVTPQNLPFHNLIGLEVEVLEHPTESLRGVKGRVIFETKNTLLIETPEGKRIKVLKIGYFKFKLPDGREVVVEGWKIKGRPEERLKRFLKAR